MQRSAGILVYRHRVDGRIEVLLGHMGGPFWARRDATAWTVPKGLVETADQDDAPGADADDDRDADLATARREFEEETGHRVPGGDLLDLGVLRQNSSKEVHVWAVRGDIDPATCSSNTFEIEWPPKSGRIERFPELDRFGWFDTETAAAAIVTGQRPLLDRLRSALDG